MILSSRTSPHNNIFTCYTVDKIDKIILWLSRLWIRIWKQTRYFQSRRPAAYLNTASVPGGIAGTLLFFTMIFVLSFISLSTIICPDLLLIPLDLRRRLSHYHSNNQQPQPLDNTCLESSNHRQNEKGAWEPMGTVPIIVPVCTGYHSIISFILWCVCMTCHRRNCPLESIHLVPPT